MQTLNTYYMFLRSRFAAAVWANAQGSCYVFYSGEVIYYIWLVRDCHFTTMN
jgi:hypothetical protein